MNWPTYLTIRYDLRTLEALAVEMRWVADLHAGGVPADLLNGVFRAIPVPIRVRRPDGDYVQFGVYAIDAAIGLDVEDGTVRAIFPDSGQAAIVVNTTLAQFRQTVEALTDRFPFYSREEADERAETAAEDIVEICQGIDPEALARPSFWDSLVDSVSWGDMSTEEIVERRWSTRRDA